jgi:EmrB/QacA subfamily drug resistance transporter
MALFMGMLDNLVVTTALPSIKKALGASVSDLQWTIDAYTLAFTIIMLPAAALGDRWGRKRFFLVGVALFTAGSTLAALSADAGMLGVARAIQGVGAGFMTPLTLTLLTQAFPVSQRAAAIGLWSGVSGLGLAAGPLIGGAIVEGLRWNAVFWVNVPIGILLLVLGYFRLSESRGQSRSLDLPGIGLVSIGLFGLVYGLIHGNSDGWGSPQIVASLVAGVLFLAAFLVRERMARAPMVDLGLFRSRAFSAANSVGFLMSFGMFGSIFLITLFVQEIQGASPLEAGLRTMPWTATIMLVAPVAGLLVSRIGARPLVLAGMAAQALALFWLGTVSQPGTPYTTLLPAFVLGGLGMGLSFAPLSATVMGSAASALQGQASGVYNTVRELGGVFGVAILGTIFQRYAVTTVDGFVDGFHAALLAGSALLALSVLLSILLPGKVSTQVQPVEQLVPAPLSAEAEAA